MFSTMPYSDSNEFLAENFENRRHLTNYDINARPENIDLYMDKKGDVGKGCLWDME